MSQAADTELLRRFEPVVRYTRGERFFPMDVARYVRRASLWERRPNQYPQRLYAEGELTLERLGQPLARNADAIYYLKFIEPLNITELARYRLRERLMPQNPEYAFYAGPGRLARVGYVSRFVDAIFSLGLLTRGRVPGDTAVAAAQAYKRMLGQQERYQYYGRVIRQNGWIILQYWYFYAYNNWRSGYVGANDHEGDWEMAAIFLYQTEPGRLVPEWVSYAAHELSGDEVRRRWDDPEVDKVGEHPVIYTGAGSHAGYFQRGEYLAEVELAFVYPVARFIDRLQSFWEGSVLRYQSEQSNRWSQLSFFRVPFVDYARGDGLAIGPEQEREWAEPVLIDPPPAWVSQYYGLWGLFAQDPFAGENAPAGPMYNRDGTVRQSWYDPLGWAGLEQVPPPNLRLAFVQQRQAEITRKQRETTQLIEEKSSRLRAMGVELTSIKEAPHLRQVYDERNKEIRKLAAEIDQAQAEMAANQAVEEALQQYARRIQSGERGPARGHLKRARRPASSEGLRLNRFAELWAAISIGLMLISFIIMALFARSYLLLGTVALISLLAFIEASFRRQITRVISSLTTALAVFASLILIYEFFWQIVVVGVLVAGSYIMWENVGELRRWRERH
jgi:hypothetical protein